MEGRNETGWTRGASGGPPHPYFHRNLALRCALNRHRQFKRRGDKPSADFRDGCLVHTDPTRERSLGYRCGGQVVGKGHHDSINAQWAYDCQAYEFPSGISANLGKADNAHMKALATIRRRRRLTQAQLAEMAGLDQGTISKIENEDKGYNYTADIIQKLSAALNVEPAELFGLSELQQRAIDLLRSIEDPHDREAAMRMLEAMASKPSK